MRKHLFLFRLLLLAVSLCLAHPTLADPVMSSQNWSVDENTKSGTLLGKVTASGGTASTSLTLDVGSQSISNWNVRGEDFESVNFNSSFSATPVVMTQIQSDGNYNVIYSESNYSFEGQKTKKAYDILFLPRQKNTSTSGFQAILEIDMKPSGVNSSVDSIDWVGGSETLGWLAISDETHGIWNSLPFESIKTDASITDSTTNITFAGLFDSAPQIKTSIATSNEMQNTGVGIKSLNDSLVKVFMDEIGDGEHGSEAVSLIAIQGDGTLLDANGNVIGETGLIEFSDKDRDSASTVSLQNTYTDPVVFAQPVDTSDDMHDAGFRFTDISSNSFSGYLQDDDEYTFDTRWGTFDLHYFVFEKGTWDIALETYAYSITAGNDSGAFAIDSSTGEITIADSDQLDYESGVTQYVLTVEVVDGTGAVGSTNVTIDINNVNDSLNADAQLLDGLAANDWTGWQTATAGDVNGDGLDDIIIGSPRDDTNADNAGAAYVLFGNSSGIFSSLSDVVAGTGGFVMYGVNADDQVGQAVGGGADINGDGLDDVVIGAPLSNDNGTYSGKAYVVFGKTDTSAVQLFDIALDSNDGGFVMMGAYEYDWAGGSIALGDVNGDSLADVVLGEQLKKENGIGFSFSSTSYSNTSYAYVVYGKTDGTAVSLADVALDTDEQGFVMSTSRRNISENAKLGAFVMSSGDFNSDGLLDFVINKNLYDENNYMLFGKVGGAAITLDENITSNGEGLVIYPEPGDYGVSLSDNYSNAQPSFQTSPLGDVNGDGLYDTALFLNDSACCDSVTVPRAYVIFGTTTVADISLSDVAAGNGGFIIDNDVSGETDNRVSIGGAGDINGDGYDDILIGEPETASGNGAIYVVYGKSGTDMVYLSETVSGDKGIYSTGNANDYLGDWVSNAGDFNGDGISDMLFAAPNADPNGLGNAGTVYALKGVGEEITLWGTDSADSLTGSSGDNISAGQDDDSITANGANVVYAGAGDDTIIINSSDFIRINGGSGTDTLQVDGAGISLYLSEASAKVRDIEIIDIGGSGANILSFNKNISGSNRIIVKGDADDSVYSVNQQWVDSGTTETIDGITYQVYSVGNAEFLLQSGMSISINAEPVINAQSFSVDEYTEGGTTIGTVTADSGDIGDSVSFAITAGNDAGYFSLDADSGELSIADSVGRLDYESGASYDLTVEVTDLFGATASAVVTVNVNDFSVISKEFAMDASGGGSIWGSWESLSGLLGTGVTDGEELSWDLGAIDGMPIDTEIMDLSMEGTFKVGASYSFEGGTVEANLPVTLALEYPDEVQPGVSVRLSTSLTLDDGAGFEVDSPAFSVEAYALLEDYDIQLSTNIPSLVSDASGYDGQISGNSTGYEKVIESDSDSASSSQNADNPLLLEAEIDLPDWVDEEVSFTGDWTGLGISLDNYKEKCIDEVFANVPNHNDLDDLYYKLDYAILEATLQASADLYHDFSVELQPTAVLTLEDGSEHSFDPTEGLVFMPEESHDSDGDGVIEATLSVSLNPVFINDTELNTSLYMPLTTGYVSYAFRYASCTSGGGGTLSTVIYKDSAGPMIDAEVFSLNAADLTNTPITYSLSDITYTEQLAFDLCDGEGTACAESANTAPTASDVSISGTLTVNQTVTGSYTYADEEGNAESGSSYQWRLADNDAGTNASDISGTNSTSYTIDNGDSNQYLQFCVTPDDGETAGTQSCSAWSLVSGNVNSALTAGFDKALLLNGVDKYGIISTNNAINLQSTSFTIETWFRSDTSKLQHILHQRTGSDGAGPTWLSMNASGQIMSGLGNKMTSANVITFGKWHHVALSYDASSGILSMYLDGELDVSGERTLSFSDGDIVLGAAKNLSGKFFSGALDETRVWTEARTQAQIQQHMGLSVSADEPNLLFYYTYDNDTGTTVSDATGNYPATLNHSINLTDSTDQMLSFDGVGDYVEIADHANLEFDTNSFSVEAWAYADSDSSNDWRNIVSKKQGTGSSAGWLLRLSKTDGALYPTLFVADGSSSSAAKSPTAVTEGTWYHIAGVVDRSTDTVMIYVDGELMASTSVSNMGSMSSAVDMRIGIWSTYVDDMWNGNIDDVRVWNDARSQAEIQDNMYNRLSGDEANLVAYYSFEDGGAADITGNGHNGTLQGDTTSSYRGIAVATTGSGDLSGLLPMGAGSVSVYLDAEPTLGTVTLDNSTGEFTYSPTDSSSTGIDSFSYYVMDSNGDYSYSETVSIELEALTVGGGTSGSSVSAGALINQLQQSQTLVDNTCTPQNYLVLGIERTNRYSDMSYLEGVDLQQNPFTGALEVKLDDVQFGLQPYDLVSGGNNSLSITPDIIALGADGEVLMTRPALLNPCTLENLLGAVILTDEGLLQVPVDAGVMYLARPAWSAQRVETASDGLVLQALPANPTLPLAVLQFNDTAGTWQQVLYPALADRTAMENFLGEPLTKLGEGQLSATLDSGDYHFIPDYLVTEVGNPSGVFTVEPLGDKNGDGFVDFALIYADGKRQEVYGVE